jgi:pimeloyl-ACP methyl ester carboxylesterase
MTDAATLPLEPVSRHHRSQGLNLHYLDWGGPEGAPLLLLVHGARDHARSWDWAARALRQDGWRVVAPDLRGHGDSDWSPDAAYLASYHVLDLADLIDHLGEPELTVIGHSFGGVISTRYAAMYPERIRKLVLIDGMGPGPEVLAMWDKVGSVSRTRDWIEKRRGFARRPPLRFATVEDAVARMAAGSPHLSAEQAQHMARHGARRFEDGWGWKSDPLMNVFPPEDFYAETAGVWEAVACPTLLFWGPKSYTANPLADGRTKLLKDHRMVIYEDAGHWLHHERLDDVLAEIRSFL